MDKNSNVPPVELQARVEKIQKAMAARDVGGALIVQKTDLFYFSGTGQQGVLYIPVEGSAYSWL